MMEGLVAQVLVRQEAGEFGHFDADAFDHAIGTTTKLKTSVGVVPDCATVVDATVAEDGTYVDLVLEFPYAVAALLWSGLIS